MATRTKSAPTPDEVKAAEEAAAAEAQAAEEAAAANEEGSEDEGEGDNEPDTSGAVVNPSALLARAQEAEANSDRKPPMATWGQLNFLLYLTLRVVLGFDEDQANEARTRSGASGLISTLKDDGVKQGIITDKS